MEPILETACKVCEIVIVISFTAIVIAGAVLVIKEMLN